MKRVNDERYYSSELSEYIHKNIPFNHTTLNVDLTQFKIWSNFRIYRFIEIKRTGESYGDMQHNFLQDFAELIKIIRYSDDFKGKKIELFTIVGDPPYDSITILDWITGKEVTIEQPYVKLFLGFAFDPFTNKYFRCCSGYPGCGHFGDEPIYRTKMFIQEDRKFS